MACGDGDQGANTGTSSSGARDSVISFTRYEGDATGHVFTMRRDGSGATRVTSGPGVQAHSTLSPDGTTFAYTQVDAAGSSVLVTERRGGEPRVLNRGRKWSMVPSWSPDATRIAFTSDADGNYEIYTMRADGSDVRQLTFTAPPIQHVGPKYSPDGATLLYATDEDEQDPANQQDLWVMPSNGGTPTRLTKGINDRESRNWSPDGQRIVTQDIKAGVGQLVVMNADGTDQRQITEIPRTAPTFSPGGIFPAMRGAVTPAWSPDGAWIAFASNHEGNYDIYVIRPDGTGMRRLAATPRNELSVGWGPSPSAPTAAGPQG